MKSFALLVPAVFAATFLSCENKNTLKHFQQSGKQTLIEVTDSKGRSWKVHSTAVGAVKTVAVFNKKGQVGAAALILGDSAQTNKAILFTDATFKGRASSLLQKDFLSTVTNGSRDYSGWVNQFAAFETRTINMTGGALGSGNVRFEGDKIVGLWKDLKCHCHDGPFCSPGMTMVARA